MKKKSKLLFLELKRNQVLKAMLAAHPYEEPAYDVIMLDQRTNEFGLGRIGKLS